MIGDVEATIGELRNDEPNYDEAMRTAVRFGHMIEAAEARGWAKRDREVQKLKLFIAELQDQYRIAAALDEAAQPNATATALNRIAAALDKQAGAIWELSKATWRQR